jgi:calcium-dependent protein kinase
MKGPQEEVKDVKSLKLSKGDFIAQHSGIKFKDYYKIMDNKLLGQGAFGKVKKCVNLKTKIVHAVKIMEKSKMDKGEKVRLSYEIDILKNLDHPNIVKLYEVFEDDKYMYLVTELCTGGELFDIISDKTFTEKEAAEIIKQVLQAIAYCHKCKVAHRDMKPENILIDSVENEKMTVKIIDFGTSQVYDAKENMT